MQEKSYVSYAYITVYSRDPDGHGIGVELRSTSNLYCFMSLWLPKAQYQSIRSCIPRIFEEIFAVVPESHQLVRLRSTILYFEARIGEMRRRARQFANGRHVDFQCIKTSQPQVLDLAVDAAVRKTSIVEVLEELD